MRPQLTQAKRLVVKIGSSLIIDEATGGARHTWMTSVCADIAALVHSGKQVIVVTSGAVALGHKILRLSSPLPLEEKQAAAACGQIALMQAWQEAAAQHGLTVAQILLTAEDSEDRRRYLNARNTLDTLLESGALPIVNENDTVATAEIRVGDNDRLAARVAQMAGAEVLVLLSDIDGLYTANPRVDLNARFIPEIRAITPEIEAMAGGSGSSVGTGGMSTKIAAAKIALHAGCHMVITQGTQPHPLEALQKGAKASWFIASATPIRARKQWIAGVLKPAGVITVDAGAAAALAAGKSLLPVGVLASEGSFERGDAVIIQDQSGKRLACGLIAYDAADTLKIRGQKSEEIEKILGFKGRHTLIHRDDLVIG